MKQLLNFSVVIMFLLLGGCVNTSEQEHGEMITEIIENYDKPDMTREKDGPYSRFVNLRKDVSSVVKKYFPVGITRKEVVQILKQQKIDDYSFATYDYKHGVKQHRSKRENFKHLDKTQKFVSGFSQIYKTVNFSEKEDFFYHISQYHITIGVELIDDKVIDTFGRYSYNLDYKL